MLLVSGRPVQLSIPSLKVIQFNSVLFYLCAGMTAIRPVSEIVQGLKEMQTTNENTEKRSNKLKS
jgi:hypothetical protein